MHIELYTALTEAGVTKPNAERVVVALDQRAKELMQTAIEPLRGDIRALEGKIDGTRYVIGIMLGLLAFLVSYSTFFRH